jgi:protein TonB
VIAVHAGLSLLIPAAKSVAPLLPETPLMAHFIDPPRPVEVEVKVEVAAEPLPMAAPEPPPAPPQKTIAPKRSPPRPRKAAPPPAPDMAALAALAATAGDEPAPANAPVALASEPAASAAAASPVAGASAAGGDGAVVGARFDADYLMNPAPPYPPQARRLGEEGKVILRVLVSATGGALRVELETSSGSQRLDDSALRTVRAWKFVPAKRAGAAIESWVLVPILFKLEQ